MSTTLAAALAAALTFPAPTPTPASALAVDAPVSDQVALGVLSLVDMEQTNIWLHTHVGSRVHQPYEENPLLGKHPSMTRMLVTGAVMDAAILHLRSPALRRFAIGIEFGNVVHNLTLGMHL